MEIYGYDAPFAKTKNLPENFLLKKIGSDTIEERGEYNNLEFDAMIKNLPYTLPKNEIDFNEEIDDSKKTKIELMKIFKNKAFGWSENNLTDDELIHEIEILIESRLVEIEGLDSDSFNEIELIIPQWLKKLVDFWYEGSISEQEFINALQYVLKINIFGNQASY